ncbi:sorbosone dehydrogenase family protein (plasmid) [Agrobacterium sp. 33MFTa1.1]|uniref:PQQ-dependent sugar dehydrogenase n=1 Tax=Agrobacterium sp. 33MFTa1.1 TaxID=1279031 RepID=UPI00054FA57C|nr:PQQ-dependent sugar dehydrogenase [Agrobacterium sp. 33MFTa1.1]QBJ16714.1 sorbosone dehydrogenase family protein [Agrobacterium sp. 33MFTa1.1]
MRKLRISAIALTCMFDAAAISAVRAESLAHSSVVGMSTGDWNVETVVENLDYPWDIEVRGDRVFVTEAAGNIVFVQNGQMRRYVLHTTADIAREGGGGLLGMALAKDFENSGRAYFYHTYRFDGSLRNKVIEAVFDGTSWRETRTLLADIPGHRLYNGGRLAIGPDGNLYVTTGWTENRDAPQDITNLAGKVLRMTLDGKMPSDNPIAGSYVYSLGHRNPQGLAWDPAGELFVAEYGQSAHDEINHIKPGLNFGWPLTDGDRKRQGMQAAYLHSGNETWAPSGISFRGTELLVATLVGRGIYVLGPQANELEPIYKSEDRYRDVLSTGNDIYAITTNRSPRGEGPSDDRLIKLSPKH